MAEGALRELLAYFSVEVDDKALKQFDAGVTGAIQNLQAFGAGFVGFFALREVKQFFSSTIEQAAALGDMSAKLGVSTDALQKFQFAAGLHGVAEGGQLLGRLNKQIGEAAGGSAEAGKDFAKLGISLKNQDGSAKDTMDVIDELSDHIAAMKTGPERAATAMKIFGRQGQALIPLLAGGKDALHKVYKEFEGLGGLMSEDFIKSSHDAADEMQKFDVTMTGLRVRLVNAFLPAIIKVVVWFKEFVIGAQHVIDKSNGIRHTFELIKWLAIAAGIYKVIRTLEAMAAAESIVDALNPFMLMAAAIAAAILVYDDLKTALEGGKSVFGSTFGTEGVDKLRHALEDAKQVLDAMLAAWRNFKNDLTGEWKRPNFVKWFETPEEKAKADQEEAQGQVAGILDDAKATVDNYLRKAGLPTAGQAATTANNEALFGVGMGSMEVASPSGGAGNTNINVVNHNTVKVAVDHTSTDPADVVGKAIGQGAQKELDKAMLNSLNAVKTK